MQIFLHSWWATPQFLHQCRCCRTCHGNREWRERGRERVGVRMEREKERERGRQFSRRWDKWLFSSVSFRVRSSAERKLFSTSFFSAVRRRLLKKNCEKNKKLWRTFFQVQVSLFSGHLQNRSLHFMLMVRPSERRIAAFLWKKKKTFFSTLHFFDT